MNQRIAYLKNITEKDTLDIEALRELVFASDNKACFIERERILRQLQEEMADYDKPDKYAIVLSRLLSQVSTPVLECDFFAGRVVEALPDPGMEQPCDLLASGGHMSFDYAKLLKIGLKGILQEMKEAAAHKKDEESSEFVRNAEIVIGAIKDYTQRYAVCAQEKGFSAMAEALQKVPYEPAYDFYSALQGIWIMHMIASCYVGSRDYAFGRFDEYMLPYYEKALEQGHSEAELTTLLAGFLMKSNEICGRATHNYERKPVLCQASKQYVNIGGEHPNAFSTVVLNAAKMNNMAQPQIIVLLKPEADAAFTEQVFDALSVLTDKMNIYNYDLITSAFMEKGIPEDIAKDFTYSACCTVDLNYHTFRQEYYVPIPQIFVSVLHEKEYTSVEEILEVFQAAMKCDIQKYVDKTREVYPPDRKRKYFVLDSLMLSDTAKECRYPCDGNSPYNVLNIFCPGIATIGDSLMVLDRLIFREKRYTYREFMQILKDNYEHEEVLFQEINAYTMFGNDTDIDRYTTMAGTAFLDAVDLVAHKDNYYMAPGFYSLERDNRWKDQVGATPNARKAGEPFSENQSPTYGADKNGITALLKSISKLPFDRTVCGGLNLTFSNKVSAEILQAVVLSYFALGGFHVGISVIDRKTLEDAMVHPEKYQSLTVRLYGFSEYFVNLPKWQQLAVLNRTEINL